MPNPPPIPRRSPSGQPTCPNVGPLDARIVCIAESPARNEIRDQEPLVGSAGRLFNKGLLKAGIDRAEVRIINPVPCLAPGNEFAKHTEADLEWGRRLLQAELDALEPTDNRVIVTMGNHPTQWVVGVSGITSWRGSLFPPEDGLRGDPHNEYWTRLRRSPEVESLPNAAHLPTYHPAAVRRQMPWHVWFNRDLQRARQYADGEWEGIHYRRWYIEQPEETERLIYEVILPHEHLVSIDTEMDPPVVSLVTEDEVHAFVYSERYRDMLTDLMSSPSVLKVAHNAAHDWRQFEKWWGVRVEPPQYDTLCLAHIMEPSGDGRTSKREQSAGKQMVGKKLSPHISTQFTPWPHHKWLEALDVHAYCGMDTVVAYDAYWTQIEEATEEQIALANFDMRLFRVLFRMMERGIRVDVERREEVMAELKATCDRVMGEFVSGAEGVVRRRWDRARKPHLFRVMKRCPCCNGGKAKSQRCWSCAGFEGSPTKAELLSHLGLASSKKLRDELEEAVLGPCLECGGEGEHEEWLEFNIDSNYQIADLFYRMLGVPPRRLKSKETTAIDQMERMLHEGGYLSPEKTAGSPRRRKAAELLHLYVEWNRANNDYETAERITPGEDGRTRCNFDLWYVPSGRVASRETLLDAGTNLQNIPKEARKLLIPTDGWIMGYPDYRQVEGRSLAVITGDEALWEEYRREDADSHSLVARMVTEQGVPITRDQAKRVFFATCYGVEAPHLATVLGCSEVEAKEIINAILRTFPGVRRYRDDITRQLLSTRSVRVIDGWERRWLGHVMNTRGRKAGTLKGKVLKEGLATPPQRMGARVLGEGIIALDELALPGVAPIGHVHDASLLEFRLETLHETVPAAEEAMSVELWGMPFPVDMSLGPNWYVASIPDKEKVELGLEEWTRDALLK